MQQRDNQPPYQGYQQQNYVQSNPQYNPPPPYSMKPPQYVVGQPLPQTTITQEVVYVEGQNTAAQSQLLCQRSRVPVLIICPYCRQKGNSATEYVMGDGSWCCVCLLFCFCSILCWLPCCIEDCQDVEHHCQFCDQLIAVNQYKVCD